MSAGIDTDHPGPDTAATKRLVIRGGQRLSGTVVVPGDKSISHRALLVAALAGGTSTITGLSDGDDVARTAGVLRLLGVPVVASPDGDVTVDGGRDRVRPPQDVLDFGNSGTGIRLTLGVLAGLGVTAVLSGDESLRRRPMDRVAEPLTAMGARIGGTGSRCLPPVQVAAAGLTGIDYRPPMASAQVKSAVLLAGISAAGETVVREPVPTRAHTEELLAATGAAIDVSEEHGERVVRVRRSDLAPGAIHVPGDPSQAAFWVVAALLAPGSSVVVDGVYLGTARAGFLDVLARMGASVTTATSGGAAASAGSLSVHHPGGLLRGTVVEAAEIPSLDEVPILALAAATARGPSRFRDVGELRVKESDRLEGVVALLRAFGCRADVDGDDLVVAGGSVLRAATFDPRGDHRLAMTAAVAGLTADRASGVTSVTSWEMVDTSYPGFVADLERLGGCAEVTG
ncbi:MAG: 3-phosphoshikimate 1-carboxyvinyltransferase [Acidimicrobiales bacterium]|nr:3-phosphoshikimate 1-carboxyvinyltransferase [Actinomycetota bacterium]